MPCWRGKRLEGGWFEQDMESELRAHLDLKRHAWRVAGLPRAGHAARRAPGNTTARRATKVDSMVALRYEERNGLVAKAT